MRRSLFPVLLGSFALLASCSSPPTMTGKVTDIFGNPLVGAKVAVGELGTHFSTDARGQFSIEVEHGTQLGLRAGLDGYIPDFVKVDIPAECIPETGEVAVFNPDADLSVVK